MHGTYFVTTSSHLLPFRCSLGANQFLFCFPAPLCPTHTTQGQVSIAGIIRVSVEMSQPLSALPLTTPPI